MATDTADNRGRSLEHHFARHCERLMSSASAAEESERIVFLTRRDVSALHGAAGTGGAISPSTARFSELAAMLVQGHAGRLRLVIDDPRLSDPAELDSFLQTLTVAFGLEPGAISNVPVIVLANAVADCEAEDTVGGRSRTPLEALSDGVADSIFEVRRRVDDYFEHEPLVLPANDIGRVELVTAESVAAWLASDDASTRAAGIHVLRGESPFTWREFAETVARAAGIPAREADSVSRTNAVQTLIEQSLRHVGAWLGLSDDAQLAREDDRAIDVHRLSSSTLDWCSLVTERVTARLASHRQRTAPRFSSLASFQRRSTRAGDTYLRAGNDGPALLLVNAFGLSHDVWHDFADALIDRFNVFAIDDEPGREESSLTRTYYAAPDALPRFIHAVADMLAEEGYTTCHVASWCGGAKYAIELARTLPDSIASLSLFAPSFAGAEGYAGSDSIYETNLHTMCKLVDRMPQAAQSMAKSMITLLDKQEKRTSNQSGDTNASVFELADHATRHWLHAPFLSASNMVEYSRQLLNFRAHRIEGLRKGELRDLPVMLVTGQNDTMTCSTRARAICLDLCRPLHFELRHASHHLIHQNAELLARLMKAFAVDGASTVSPHPRLSPVPAEQLEQLEQDGSVVLGEI
ncbi:alpha/beta fold hydrolase [Paraburkholderia sp. CI3]|uniref:alpha/beta fold hydrolase n=1 Tax=Paraburkholderia sp. CI3 TaxID=2991060 RepID=UPI003D1D905F